MPDRGDPRGITAQIPVVDDSADPPRLAAGGRRAKRPSRASGRPAGAGRPGARRPAPRPDDMSGPMTAPILSGVNHLGSAAVALVVGCALATTAWLGVTDLLVGVAVTQGLLVISWVLGTALPGRIGAMVVGALAAGGADTVVARWPHGQLGTLLGVLALAVPAMFVHQLTRGVVRARVTESLSDIAVLVVAVVAFAALIQLRHESGGKMMATGVLLAATAALVVGHLVDMIAPVPRFDVTVPRGLLAVLAAIAAAAAVAYLRLHDTVEFTSGRAGFMGGAIGGIVSLFAIGAAFMQQTSSVPIGVSRLMRPVFGVLVPLGLLAPVAYLLCLAIRG